jgi:hypothetical protein
MEIDVRAGIRENDGIMRVLPGQHRGYHQPVRQQNGHVFAAVDGEVNLPSEQSVFDFLHEQPLPANLCQ